MNDICVKIMRTSAHTLPLPCYATPNSAAFDLRANLPQGEVVLKSNESYAVPTGFAMEIPNGFVGLVFARSGLAAKNNVNLTNGVGVIDSDYRGEIKVLLYNAGKNDFVITHEMRVAQMMLVPYSFASFDEVDSLSDTERGSGGFGSTGTK